MGSVCQQRSRRKGKGAGIVLLLAICLVAICAGRNLLAQVSFLGTQSVLPGIGLSAPYGVVTDAAGNIYVSDPTLHEVVCYTANNVPCGAPFPMQTGLSQPKGMAIDSRGDIFVADAGAGAVLELVHTASGYSSPATLADSLDDPEAVALDSGANLYVAVAGSGEIVELPLNGQQYGAPSVILHGLGQPVGIAFDAYDTMYIAEVSAQGIFTSKQQFGAYAAPQLYLNIPGNNGHAGTPGSLMMDASMVLYVTDQTIHQVLAYQLNPYIPHPVALWDVGSGLQSPGQVAEDAAGNILLSDSGSGEVSKFSRLALPFATQSVGAAAETQVFLFSVAQGTSIGAVNLSSAGNVQGDFQSQPGSDCVPQTYAAAATCSMVVGFAPTKSGVESGAISFWGSDGEPLLTTYLYGTGNASRAVTLPAAVSTIASGLTMPTGVAVDGRGNLYVTDGETYTVSEYSQSAGAVSSAGTLSVNAVNAPVGLAVDGAGNLLVASSGNDRVIQLEWNGAAFVAQKNVGSGMYVPSGVAVQPSGAMCVANTYENQVNCYNWTGTSYVHQPPGNNYGAGGTFGTFFPLSAAIDALGDVFWVQPYQNQVTEFNNITGLVHNLWQGSFQFPNAVAVDGEGDLYVLDSGHNRVMMLVPVNGVYQQPILVASGFNAPQGLAADAAGNLYVADTGNHRVVKITMTESAPLVFATTTSGGNSVPQVMQVLSVGALPTTVTGVSFPPDFSAATISASGTTTCSAGVRLQQGQSCTVSATFTPQQANAQFAESIAVTAQMASGAVISYTVPMQGTSASLAAQTIQFAAQPPVVYGQRMVAGYTSFTLAATSSAGLAVSFAVVSGPGMISGGNTLEATGVGTIVVRATQAGNAQVAAATPVEQSFTVMPATLTLTASNQKIVYGASASSFGYTITGLVSGDSAASAVSGNPVITSSAGAHPSVGSYAIQISAGTLTAANYTFAFVPGTLTVTPAILTLMPNPQEMAMGGAVPALTYFATGLVGGDTLANATSGAPVLSTAATPQSPPGNYPILMAAGTLQAKNYLLTLETGVLQVVWVGNLGFNPPGGLAPPPFRLHGAPILPFVGAVAEDHGTGNGLRGSNAMQPKPGEMNWGADLKQTVGVAAGGFGMAQPEEMNGMAAAPAWVTNGIPTGMPVGMPTEMPNGSAVCAPDLDAASGQSGPTTSGNAVAQTSYCAASAPAAMEER